MKKKKSKNKETKKPKIYGDPEYGPDEDIYGHAKKLNLDTDDEAEDAKGLDIPGSELDDDDELIGEEDEENNYYSLGSDNHEDLEEDRE